MKQSRNTKQRQLILAAVTRRNDHPSADDIYNEVKHDDPHISRATVYRNLNMLAEAGEILHIYIPENSARFDFRPEEHYHFFCWNCGQVCDVSFPYMENLNALVDHSSPFKINSHYLLFCGLCQVCQTAYDSPTNNTNVSSPHISPENANKPS